MSAQLLRMLELRHFKQMIYYYFTSKEQLYLAVLEKLYGDIRATEAALKLDQLDPEAAIRCRVEFTFEHHHSNVDFIRLVSIENIHHGVHLAESQVIRSLNKSILAEVAKILDRGVAAGIFRPGIEPRDLHLLISSFCFFRVSNRHTSPPSTRSISPIPRPGRGTRR